MALLVLIVISRCCEIVRFFSLNLTTAAPDEKDGCASGDVEWWYLEAKVMCG